MTLNQLAALVCKAEGKVSQPIAKVTLRVFAQLCAENKEAASAFVYYVGELQGKAEAKLKKKTQKKLKARIAKVETSITKRLAKK